MVTQPITNKTTKLATAAQWFTKAKAPAQTAKYDLQAGLAAKAVFAWAEAQAHFDQALVSLKQEAACLRESEGIIANRRLQIQVFAGRGFVFRLLGDMEAYARDTQEVARLAELIGDRPTSAYLHWREAYTHRWFCRYPETRLAAEAGHRLSQAGIDPLLEARCLREIGLANRETGNHKQAQVILKRAVALFIGLGDVIETIHTLGDLSTLCRYAGEYGQALSFAQQALTRCEEAQLPFERRRPLGDVGAAAASTDQVNLASQSLLESLSIARQIDDYRQQIFCLGHLGWFCLRLKRPVQALGFLQAALALAEGIGSLTEQSWLLAGLAEAHRLADDLELAVEFARSALKLAHTSGRTYDCQRALRILARLR